MSQSFNRTVLAHDNRDFVGLRAPSLRSDNIDSSVLGSREPVSGFETISNLESEEEHIGSSSPQNSEDYIESDDDRADSYTADEPFEEQIDLVNTGLSDIDYLDSAVRAEATPTVEQASQAYARLLGQVQKEIYNRITISDDRSTGSKIEERNLIALRGRRTDVPPFTPFSPTTRPRNTLQDYQMHMRLIEQQKNRKRLLKARQNQVPSNSSAMMDVDPFASGPAGLLPPNEFAKVVDDHAIKIDIEQVLDQSDPSKVDLRKLQQYIELLQAQARGFESIQSTPAPSRYQIIYRIPSVELVQQPNGKQKWTECHMPFFDHPEWVRGQGTASQLKSSLPLTNFELYLEKNKDISFLVYRKFNNGSAHTADQPGPDSSEKEEIARRPHHVTETVRLVNRDLIEVIKALLVSQQHYAELAHEFSVSLELPAPYLFIYHSRKGLDRFQDNVPGHAKAQLSLLLAYVTEQYAEEYATADSLLAQNKISPKLLHYLFKPGDLLVSNIDGQYQGYVSKSWPKIDHNKTISRMRAVRSQMGTAVSLYGSQDAKARMANDQVTVHVCVVEVWHWAFDGNFQRQHSTLSLEIPAVGNDENATDTKGNGKITPQNDRPKDNVGEKKISELNVFPMQYASAEIVDNCRRRGKTFWKCRVRCYVSYQATEKDSIQNLADERYMIDLKTYSSLHPESSYGMSGLVDELGPEALAQDVPPDEQFELLLPLKIKGYNLRLKKWFDLAADHISDVKWNKEAFQNLVIDRKARDLIRALVSNQLAAEKGTDLIMGKGNGLILLLHGGPGTGKTLTAESVAEIAEKPLYRVTCGDVGTKAEDVEKYLESVLHLGKIWGCVVLLDEADVFLEQRSLEDMERNALVSVFLRVLEYYEGILVLTSNRVGTFDEAFKSRIQLALHYPVLGPYQRLRIWENFINRLESFAEDDKVDIADLRDHLEDLKEEKMNGRQIRNAITTARQYAEWKGSILTYKYLSEVIEISGRFDKYLDRLNGDFTQDQLAEDEGLRLAG